MPPSEVVKRVVAPAVEVLPDASLSHVPLESGLIQTPPAAEAPPHERARPRRHDHTAMRPRGLPSLPKQPPRREEAGTIVPELHASEHVRREPESEIPLQPLALDFLCSIAEPALVVKRALPRSEPPPTLV